MALRSPTSPVPGLPLHLSVPAIGVDASQFIAVGLDPDGTLQTPRLDQPDVVAWYSGSPAPGDPPRCAYALRCVQPTVLDGHIDANGVTGVFARLAQLPHGAKIALTRADGRIVTYTVAKTLIFDKTKFPTDNIYGFHAPSLVLITCGPGKLERTPDGASYVRQTAVLATMN